MFGWLYGNVFAVIFPLDFLVINSFALPAQLLHFLLEIEHEFELKTVAIHITSDCDNVTWKTIEIKNLILKLRPI